ncbi:hypothetical protein ABH908_000132 [Pseudomonas frederiksbergensis]|uniref:hypothetical protein n=1 Tax=Pseudomonas TaxID=286 RepID=UPI003D24E872
MSAPSDAPKRPKTKFYIAQGIGITSCMVSGFLNWTEWVHAPLIALALGAFIYAGLLAVKSDKAQKEWLEKQADYVDPYKGSPEYPHQAEGAAIMIGFCSFLAFGYFALPMKDRALSSTDWWVLLPLILMIAGFGYARRVHKKHAVAFTAWREAQQLTDNPLK